MKLDKLTQQLDSNRQQALDSFFSKPAAEPETAQAPPERRSRRSVEGSKRTTWKMRAWYVRPETASRLVAYVTRRQEAGATLDASDVVDQAIAAWLDQQAD